MVVIFWWLLPLWLIGLFIIWRFYKRHRIDWQKKQQKRLVAVAHSERLTSLPSYVRAFKRYRFFTRIALLLVVAACLLSIILSLRPARQTVERPELKNRDIMLCLDTSGSMREADKQLLKTFAELSKQFDGERIGLTVFNSTPASIFPLTNDYQFVQERLAELATYIETGEYNYELFGGTLVAKGTSLIGDGLAGCVQRFDTTNPERSRSIVLATDNELAGESIVSIGQAANIAKSKNIRIYGINPDRYAQDFEGNLGAEAQEYKDAVLYTGGSYYLEENITMINDIVRQISEQDATRFKGAPQLIRNDQPQIFILLLAICVLGFSVLTWRFRL